MANEKNIIFTEKQYSHYISLGHFCSVALELERIGLRSSSYPFDWLISDFKGVIESIEHEFIDFLDYDYLLQNRKIRQHYYNTKYRVYFYHDFNQYNTLKEQLPKVKMKYKRRIERFYSAIAEPTLFIRYISNGNKSLDGKPAELQWIEDNYQRITKCLKSFCAENDILFIANDDVHSNVVNIYHVAPDENDAVARKPLDKNKELKLLLEQINFEKRIRNLECNL